MKDVTENESHSLTPARDALFATLEKQGHIKIFGIVGIPGPSGIYGIYGWQTGDGRRAIVTETYEGDCVLYEPKKEDS